MCSLALVGCNVVLRLSPEIFLKRPVVDGNMWRLDHVLKRKAVSMNICSDLGLSQFHSDSHHILMHLTVHPVLHLVFSGTNSSLTTFGFCSATRSEDLCPALQRSGGRDGSQQRIHEEDFNGASFKHQGESNIAKHRIKATID